MILSTAILRVRYRIGEATPSYWTDAELTSYLNDAKDDLQNAILTINKDFFQRTGSLAIVAGTNQYVLPSDFVRLKSIRASTSGLEMTSFIPMDRNTQAFLGGLQNSAYSNSPYQFMYDIWQNIDNPALGSLKGMNISFSPLPQSNLAVVIEYDAALADLASAGDSFDFLSPLMGYILDKATYYALSKGPAGDYQNYGSNAEIKLNRILAVASKVNQQGQEFVAGYCEDAY